MLESLKCEVIVVCVALCLSLKCRGDLSCALPLSVEVAFVGERSCVLPVIFAPNP